MEGFDLFTFIATIINFIVLVILLRIFLYKRILNAMDKRQQKIQQNWDEAEANRNQAERNAQEYQKKRQDMEQREEELLEEARERSRKREQELVNEAREETEAKKREWEKSIQREHEKFVQEVRERTGKEIMNIMNKILIDLADSELQKKITDKFIRVLPESGKMENISGDVQISSAGELDDESKKKIESAVREQAGGNGLKFTYRRDPDLVSGIELSVQSRKISWNIRQYMDEAADNLSQFITSKGGKDQNE
ncbi:MAG: F0F1 ATP synthase subunit delta [Spirochaetia bacterium]